MRDYAPPVNSSEFLVLTTHDRSMVNNILKKRLLCLFIRKTEHLTSYKHKVKIEIVYNLLPVDCSHSSSLALSKATSLL